MGLQCGDPTAAEGGKGSSSKTELRGPLNPRRVWEVSPQWLRER